MNIILWTIQGILAAIFGMAGLMKSTSSREKLVEKLPWVKDYSSGTVRLIGISELFGAIGLIVPILTGILPILTPIAAAGLAVIMILAIFTQHFPKNEYKEISFNAILLILAVIVSIFRF